MAKMINVGPMRIPADQLPTLVKILGATITTKDPEIRCCVEDTGCDNAVNCPHDFQELFSHLKPGGSQTMVCEETGDLVSIHRQLK